MIFQLNELKIPLLAVVTDSVPAYNIARKCIQPAVLDDTRWNSYYNFCRSLSTTKNALQSLATKFKPLTSTTKR
ncbi:hypothetical protein RCL_jg21513.t1 [Rhizophagus clarus]|uniref:Uncharacterized protein n=1 Tax=Rhizophagus clarus TaxID=94130 RepID=A0A8H3L1W7_9GLOM|nr:hypothetical protein RCL_jg21513.t1 [Rhizophagus clarus]